MPVTPTNPKEIGNLKASQSIPYKDDKGQDKEANQGKGIRSQFNRHALFQYKGHDFNGNELSRDAYTLEGWQNVTSPASKNPTASKIIQAGEIYPSAAFDVSDFTWCKYYAKIPNNQMLTLRRFPIPTSDNLFQNTVMDANGQWQSLDTPDMARAVTWMGESTGNPISSILNFGVGFNWKEVEAEMQEMEATGGAMDMSGGGLFSSIMRAGQGINAAQADLQSQYGNDPLKDTYPNHVFGPLNVINKTFMQDRGLTFDQSFELNFHYNLRSIGGGNAKLQFLDLLSNLLVLSYNNAPFWGGATRYKPNMRAGKPMGDYNKLVEGDVEGFKKSLMGDVKDILSNLTANEDGSQPDGVMEGGWNAMTKVAKDMFVNKMMNMFSGQQKVSQVQALLTGDPVGQWHLTIGNPLNPIAMLGNLICEDTKFEFDGPLGFDDFPSAINVTMTLKPGRPRDKGEIESMFNCGAGRMYLNPETDHVYGPPPVNILDQGYQGNKTSVYGGNPEEDGLETGTFPNMTPDVKTQFDNLKNQYGKRGDTGMADVTRQSINE